MRKNDLSVFKMEKEGFKITLKKGTDFQPVITTTAAPVAYTTATPAAAATVSTADAPAESKESSNLREITSPMVGTFYASQLFTQWPPPFSAGDVVKIPFATPAVHSFLTAGALTVPGGVAIGPDGAVYVSNFSAFAGPTDGQVVRLTNR